MIVNIYIDSSVKGLRRQNGVVGYILQMEDTDSTLTQFGTVQQVTENESYLRALKYALKRINTRCELVLWTDNQHIANAFSQNWLKNWVENDFISAKGKEIANRAEWQEIAKLLNGEVPEVRLKETHQFKQWLSKEIEKRAKKHSGGI